MQNYETVALFCGLLNARIALYMYAPLTVGRRLKVYDYFYDYGLDWRPFGSSTAIRPAAPEPTKDSDAVLGTRFYWSLSFAFNSVAISVLSIIQLKWRLQWLWSSECVFQARWPSPMAARIRCGRECSSSMSTTDSVVLNDFWRWLREVRAQLAGIPKLNIGQLISTQTIKPNEQIIKLKLKDHKIVCHH